MGHDGCMGGQFPLAGCDIWGRFPRAGKRQHSYLQEKQGEGLRELKASWSHLSTCKGDRANSPGHLLQILEMIKMIKSRELALFSQGKERQGKARDKSCKGGRMLGQFGQRGCGFSIPIEVQNLIIPGPERSGHPVCKRTALDHWQRLLVSVIFLILWYELYLGYCS